MVRRCGLVVMLLVLALVFTVVGAAQDSDKRADKAATSTAHPEKDGWSFYKLDLVVREMDGNKVLNSRTYTITQRSSDWGQLRVGSRIPTEKAGYVDIGLNLDSRVQERDEAAAFDWRMELSSLAAEPAPNGQPVIRQVRNNGQTILNLGKPTVMTTADDLSSTHKFVFEVTATRVK